MKVYILTHKILDKVYEVCRTQFYETLAIPMIRRHGTLEMAAKNGWIITEEGV